MSAKTNKSRRSSKKLEVEIPYLKQDLIRGTMNLAGVLQESQKLQNLIEGGAQHISRNIDEQIIWAKEKEAKFNEVRKLKADKLRNKLVVMRQTMEDEKRRKKMKKKLKKQLKKYPAENYDGIKLCSESSSSTLSTSYSSLSDYEIEKPPKSIKNGGTT